jgi:ankyrin repeat protein
MHWAAHYRREEAAGLLLEHKADVDAKDAWDGGTAFHGATGGGHEAVARLLLEYKADVDIKHKTGDTALMGRLMAGTRR